MRFSDLTTMQVGGAIGEFVEAATETELIEAVSERPVAPSESAFVASQGAVVLGSGSNVVASDAPHDGRVVAVRTRGVDTTVDDCAGAWVEAAAGEPWDELVALTVGHGWQGLETLAGIPGLVGASPIQNIGAYGGQVSDTVARVRSYDRAQGSTVTFAADEVGFGYRTSMFKHEPNRYVVLSVAFQLRPSPHSAPIRYAELADKLGIALGDRAPLQDVHDAVLDLRRSKGMVIDASDPQTRSVGSFFLNPIVAYVPAKYAGPKNAADTGTKLSAAWLIEHAGHHRGDSIGPGAALSTKHTLAIVTREGGTTRDVLALARQLRTSVKSQFNVELQPEPALIGCSL